MALEYNDAYGLHCDIRVTSGREITLESLDQQMTYLGLMEGAPNAKMNDRLITGALQTAGQFCLARSRPHLIEPVRRNYRRVPGDMDKARRSHYIREWLPMVRCIGSFKSFPPARDSARMLSYLMVVWFQDEYAPPVCQPALDGLLALDWNALAIDVDL